MLLERIGFNHSGHSPALILGLCATIFVVQTEAVTLTASEQFDYTAGENIEGKTGGSGWSGGWSADSDGTFTAVAPGLTYPGVGAAGNAANIQPGTVTTTYFRDLATALGDGDTFYVGFIGQKLMANDDTRYFGVGLFENNGEKTLIGQGSGVANWSINELSPVYGLPGDTFASSTSSQDQSYVLARIDLRPGVETMTFWIDPDLSKGELENTPEGGTSFSTAADFNVVNRIRLGGGGTNTAGQQASNHLMDELLISTDSPFAAGDVQLFLDNMENVAAGESPNPLFGSYSPRPYGQIVYEAGTGTTPGGNAAPATAVGPGDNVMAVDRDGADVGRRNYGQFITEATGDGTVRFEADVYVVDGQIQIGLSSDEGGLAIDGVNLSMGLNLNADGSIRAFGSNELISGVSYDLNEWEHFLIEYQLGAETYSFTVNGITTDVDLPYDDSYATLQHMFVTAGTSATTGFYDNVDIKFIIPEPASLTLIGVGLLTLIRRRQTVSA